MEIVIALAILLTLVQWKFHKPEKPKTLTAEERLVKALRDYANEQKKP